MNFSSPARSYTRDDLALAEDLARIAGRLPELIARCENNADRLSQLIDNLLDLTRIRQGRLEVKRERADLAALAREAVARSVAGHEGTPIEIDAPEPVPGLWDHLRIEQVISNLVSNAIKYGEGRPVRITVSRDPLRGEARLAVEDQGIGIAPEDQQRLFNIFERAANARSRGGLGLGLYIARQIVEAHDGRISVESAPGRGSRFTITLPQGEEHP
jgi:signal transduction histidine kinase